MIRISDFGDYDSRSGMAVPNNPQVVQDYLKGKETALRFLVGQVMKITKVKVNPGMVGGLLKENLDNMRPG